MTKKTSIDNQSRGKRLDILATEMLPKLSRAYVRTLIDEARILVNNQPQKAGYKLRAGDQVTTDFDESEIDNILPIDMPIIYEDKDILVVNKPAGVISHSRSRYHNEPSVASFIRQRTNLKGERSGIVHRLDRATSGVMICAKNNEILVFLQKQFSARKVDKTYIAIVSGVLKDNSAIIDMPIQRDPQRPRQFRVDSQGKAAQTRYTTLSSNHQLSMIELKPITGRTHQLRVHMHQLKHPILGDKLYGGQDYTRLMLHAQSIEIDLPTGERKLFTSPLPKIFKDIMA